MKVKEYHHKDFLGQDLNPGDPVAYIHLGNIQVGYVHHNSPKRTIIHTYGEYQWRSPKEPSRVLKITETPALTLHILKKSG
jgi:hypothetical protein